MSADQKFLACLAGIGVVLVAASIVGWLLGRRKLDRRGRLIVDNLNARIRAWWVLAAILGAAFVLGTTTTLVLFALVSFLAFREFITLTPTKPGDRLALFAGFFLLIPLQYALVGIEWYGLFAVFIPVYAFLLLPALTAFAQDTDRFLERISKIQWGVMLSIFCVSHAPALMYLKIPGYPERAPLLLLYLLLVAQLSDVLQYVFGKLLGRRKIAPVVSPGKTVEGFIGGGAAATAVGAAMWWITPFTPAQSAGMALGIVCMGFLGGLTLSAVKRSLGAKDWGDMIEGHGGILDRIDSICFSAPIFFHLTRYFFQG